MSSPERVWAIKRPQGDLGWLHHGEELCIENFCGSAWNKRDCHQSWEAWQSEGFSCVKATVTEGWDE